MNKEWSSLSHKVLSSILVDEGAIFPVIEVLKDDRESFPAKDRPVWDAVKSCVDENTIPTPEAVALRCNGRVKEDYIPALVNQFNDADNRKLIYNAEQLKAYSILHRAREMGRDLSNIATINDVQEVASKTSVELGGLLAKRTERGANAFSVSYEAWSLAEKFQGNAVPTGLKWFDGLAGGLWGGMNYWVGAAYKSGKSTVMRNCILSAAEAGHHTIAICAEGSRALFALDCQAMLASRILAQDPVERNRLRLSGLLLLRNFNLGIFNKAEAEAIQQARNAWERLPITVYDAKDGIFDLVTLRYVIKRDKVKYDAKAAWIDYSQLLGTGKIYEKQSETALTCLRLAAEMDIAMCVLSQKNEEGVKSGSSYSPNIKGGGEAAAAADFLFVPKIDFETNIMDIELKLSRHTYPTSGAHLTSPSSGLFLEEIETQKVALN